MQIYRVGHGQVHAYQRIPMTGSEETGPHELGKFKQENCRWRKFSLTSPTSNSQPIPGIRYLAKVFQIATV